MPVELATVSRLPNGTLDWQQDAQFLLKDTRRSDHLRVTPGSAVLSCWLVRCVRGWFD